MRYNLISLQSKYALYHYYEVNAGAIALSSWWMFSLSSAVFYPEVVLADRRDVRYPQLRPPRLSHLTKLSSRQREIHKFAILFRLIASVLFSICMRLTSKKEGPLHVLLDARRETAMT
ncbi:hypothetical protein FA10DRAFT_141694 [Acaromyces ingoldii]|uniref:Uncharacterized protein n=1 Tax=Acaromyces ingoldii TaxID=215250 RepID=A0A316YJS4_9BASI|nr:hypothetical protein FA10DRAFT_141694 [Acaromyces ingoldii]PWN89316.1 hypothetical protein FA10DRAFT_141694 [Acaromyces ingoldii]